MNYKKPAFWIVVVAVITCIAVAVCFLTNPLNRVSLSKLKSDEINMPGVLDEITGMIVTYEGISVACPEQADVNRFLATMEKIDVSRDPISLSRSEDRDKDFTIMINANTELHFNKSFTEFWVDNHVKPSLTHRITNPETAKELLLDYNFTQSSALGVDGLIPIINIPEGSTQFAAVVLEVHDTYLLVKPEGVAAEGMTDKIEISLKERESWPIPQVGDSILVVYDGNIQETYPARITKVYRVEIMNYDSGPIKTVYGNFKTYYKNTNGTWQVGGRNYKYRLVITGRMHNAAVDSTFVYLSNIEKISFDQAWKAAGLSSNMDDYFSVEDAVLVEWLSGGTKKMTLADVVELSKLGMELTWEDLKAYKGEEIGSGLYIVKYEIDPEFYLAVGDGKTTGKPMYVSLNAVSNGASCDIREGDVETFIKENQSDALDYAIHKAVIEHNADGTFPDFPNGFIPTQVHYIYGIETKSGTPVVGQLNHMEETTVYIHYVYGRYSYSSGELSKEAGNATPAKITFSVDPEKGYTLKEFWEPNGGSTYAQDIRDHFPKDIADIILNPRSNAVDTEKMERACLVKVQEYISSLTD